MTKSLKAYALNFLSKRDYSYLELQTKLKKYSPDEKIIAELLDELVKKGWLSEERYINNYISYKSQKYGLVRIRKALIYKTGNSKLVDQMLSKQVLDEYTVAFNLWHKKFGKPGLDLKEKSRQARFLANKGFSFDIINKILNK